MKVVIVTGGSSGIGRAVAAEMAGKGYKVYEFSRRDIELAGVIHMSVDVTDETSVSAAVSEIYNAEGRIDILINCAGFGISGAVEFTKTEDAIRQFDVNFFGIVRCCRAVLPYMRKAKSGRIVNISSVAGPIPIPFQAFYSASKNAINTYTGALINEVRPYSVTACCAMPGDTATGFTAARQKAPEGDEEYGGRISHYVKYMEDCEEKGRTPAVVAHYVVKLAEKKKVKPYYAVGADYKFLSSLMKLLPSRFSSWLLYMIYGK